MASSKETRSAISHSTGPVIGNNIYLNIFNAYSILPQTPDARNNPKGLPSAKVSGHKVENQIAVQISDSSLSEKTREVVCFKPSKIPKGVLFLSTPRARIEEKPKNPMIVSARDFHPLKKADTKNSNTNINNQNKLSQTAQKFYDPQTKKDNKDSGARRNKGQTQHVSPVTIQTQRIPTLKNELTKRKLGSRADSDTAFQLTNEMKEILGMSERKVDIPFSVNRFQGKYEEVVPPKIKEMKELFEREKKIKELKREEARKRVEKARNESEKIRRNNQVLLQKPISDPLVTNIQNHISKGIKKDKRLKNEIDGKITSRPEIKKKTSEERLKEIGLDFILHFKRKKSCIFYNFYTNIAPAEGKNEDDQKMPNKLFKNEHIQEIIRNQTTSQPKKKKEQNPEERERRKILVEEQKKLRIEKERKKKKTQEEQEQILKERLKEVTETQRKLREEAIGSVKLKKKGKKSRKKKQKLIAATEARNSDLEKQEKPNKNPHMAESVTEEPKKISKKMKREAIARKAEQIREQQTQRLNAEPVVFSPNSNQPQTQQVLTLSYVPKANPKGLSTSQYAPHLTSPQMNAIHTGDITAPVSGHMPEEEKHKLKDGWKEKIHDIQNKLQKHDSKKRNEEIKEPNEQIRILEEEKQITKKPVDASPPRQFDIPVEKSDVQVTQNNNTHQKDVLSKELEKIDEQFEIHGENASEQKEVEDFNKEVNGGKHIEKSSAAKEAEDYGHILQSMEDMEKDPLSIPSNHNKTEHEKSQRAENHAKNRIKEAEHTIKDYDSENEKEEEPQAILVTARDSPKKTQEEIRLTALEEETKNLNEQLRKELAEKDNLILSQALRESKLHQEYQEMLATQTKELMQKVLEVTHSMQNAHTEQMNSVVGKLCEHLEKIAQKSINQEPQLVTKSAEPSPEPKARHNKEITASEPKRFTTMDEDNKILNSDSKDYKPIENFNNVIASTIIKPIEKIEEIEEKIEGTPEELKNDEKPEELSGSAFEKSSFTEMTYSKLKQVLKSNNEAKLLKEEEKKIDNKYKEKQQEISNMKVSNPMREYRKNELEEWYTKEKKIIEATKKKLLADALKKTASMLEIGVDEDAINNTEKPINSLATLQEINAERIQKRLENIPEEKIESSPPQIHNPLPAKNSEESQKSDVKEVSASELLPAESPIINKNESPQPKSSEKTQIIASPLEPKLPSSDEATPTPPAPIQAAPSIKPVAVIPQRHPKKETEIAEAEKELRDLIESPPEQFKRNSDIEWIQNEDNQNLNRPIIVKASTGEPQDEYIGSSTPDKPNELTKSIEEISPIQKIIESPPVQIIPENPKPKDEQKPQIQPEPPKPIIEETPGEKRLSTANNIADQIYNEILASLTESPLFPKRECPITDLIEKPPEQKPKPPHGIRTALWNVESYIEEVFQEVLKDPESFIASLSIPLNRDPLFILGQIQNEDNDYFETIEQIMTQPVLPVELYLGLEHTRKIDMIDDAPNDPQHETQLTEWSNIHNKCLFDAINDALDYYRPYGLKGPPLPWSKSVRELTYRNGSVASAQEVLLGAKAKVLSWAVVNAGTLQLPNEFDLAMILMQLGLGKQTGEKSRLDQFREERLETMLASEVFLMGIEYKK